MATAERVVHSGTDCSGWIRRLLVQAGYAPVPVAGREGVYPRLRWTVARATAASGPDLAGAAYADESDGLLNLRWTPDEADWLRPDPRGVWRDLFAGGPETRADIAQAYALDDPYGRKRAAPLLPDYFGRAMRSCFVKCGAGWRPCCATS